MKKLIAIVCLLILFTVSAASAATHFPSIQDFEEEFEAAAALSKSGHLITEPNTSYEKLESASLITTDFSDTLAMQVTVQYDTLSISEIMVLYSSDGSLLSAMDFMFIIGELAICTGAISEIGETLDFMDRMDMTDHMEDGNTGSVIIGSLKYSYIVIKSLGIFFFVSISQ
jgi:hypothetical protein